jgi:hypothetical protein
LGNRMVRFGILDCPIFLSYGSRVLLMTDVSVTTVSYVRASVAKIFSKS